MCTVSELNLEGKYKNSETECARTLAKCKTDINCATLLKYWEQYRTAVPNIRETTDFFFYRKNKIILNWIKLDPTINIDK